MVSDKSTLIYGRVAVRCRCSLVIGFVYQITQIVSRNASPIKQYNFVADDFVVKTVIIEKGSFSMEGTNAKELQL